MEANQDAPAAPEPSPPEEPAMEAHHHPHHEHHKTGHHMLDLVLAGSALLLSIISILLAYHTGHNMEKLVHANSWPALQVVHGNSHTQGKGQVFGVLNAGIGPARIHRFEFVIGDVVIPDDEPLLLRRLLEVCCGPAFKDLIARSKDQPGIHEGESSRKGVSRSFLSPKEQQGVLFWPRTDANTALWDQVDEARLSGKIRMRVCYCSVFDECWISETGVFPPRSVDRCPG